MTPLVQATQLVRHYRGPRQGLFGARPVIRAVEGVDITINAGQIVGLIGESGSGKSTVGRMLLGLERSDAGQVLVEGAAMPAPDTPDWRVLRRRIQMIFQNPHSALDPRARILDQVVEPLQIFGIGDARTRMQAAASALNRVGLGENVHHRYPSALSGGQKQRAVIARALVLQPRLLVCDEPVSALDVSVGAQVIDLLSDLHREAGLGLLVISHDLSMVRNLVQQVHVMFAGTVVESGDTGAVFAAPCHPYTRLLISSVPVADPHQRRPRASVPAPDTAGQTGTGCAFAPRCPRVVAQCRQKRPELVQVEGHRVACHNPHIVGGI